MRKSVNLIRFRVYLLSNILTDCLVAARYVEQVIVLFSPIQKASLSVRGLRHPHKGQQQCDGDWYRRCRGEFYPS